MTRADELEAVARALCLIDGVDPSFEGAMWEDVVGMIQAFCAVVRWRRRGRVIAKGYTQQELDAFIRFACETLPERTDSAEETRAVLTAEGIITADGELAAEYRPATDSGKLLLFRPRTFWAGSGT